MTRGVFVDRTGIRYGRLVAVEHLGYGKWLCKCDCGGTRIARGNHLEQGRVDSCGCKGREYRHHVQENSYCHERLFNVWMSMRERCYNPNCKSFKNYGGRGIVLCDDWYNSYLSFKEWAMSHGYDPNAPYGKCTIDRIDVDGIYEPSNCRWVDLKTQAGNRRPVRECPSRWVPVELIDGGGIVVESYPSVKAASKATGYSSPTIVTSCRKNKSMKDGTRWRYANRDSREISGGQRPLFDGDDERRLKGQTALSL